MAKYRISAPDGNTYQIEGPDGATQEQVQNEVIRQNPHLAGPTASVTPTPPAKPLTGPEAIPVEPGANTTITPDKPQGWWDKYVGLQKVLPTLASGVVAGAVAPVAGVAHGLFAGKYGTRQGVADADAFAGKVSNALTYQPNNPLTEQIVGGIGNAMQNMIGVPIPTLNALGQAAPAATRAVRDVVRAGAAPVTDLATVPLAARAAEKQAALIAQSEKNAPRIETAKKAVEMGLLLDTTVSNPTKGARVLNAITGQGPRQQAMSAHNETRIQELVKEDIGLPPEARLDKEHGVASYRKAVEAAAAPYDEVAKLPTLVADGDVLQKIESLRVKPVVGGGSEAASAAARVNEVVNNTLTAAAEGKFNGAEAVRTIRKFRKEAQTVFDAQRKGTVVDPIVADGAEAKIALADTLETLIENNLTTNPDLLKQFQDARVKIATIKAYERATDFNTGKIDTGALASATGNNGLLTGRIKDIGNVAGMFPETFAKPSTKGTGITHIYRSTPGGLMGAAIGSAIAPGMGTAIGGGAGVLAGEVVGRMKARSMMTPEYQAANAVPKDYRPAPNGMRPVEPNYSPNQMVPFDPRNAVVDPYKGEVMNVPNWVPGGERFTTSPIPPGAPQLGAPTAEGTLQGVQQRRAFDYRMQKALDEQQQAVQAQQAATQRQPTGRGTLFDLDPVTGKLVPVDTTLKGATPDILMAATSRSLDTAAKKVTSGQHHMMTAAEKVVWDKTKVDLASAAPELSALTEAQITQKMLDRKWVSDTIAKAREKAAAFDEIARRASSAQAARDAVASRDRLMDLVESLQDKLSTPRPTRSGVQGKKTREAQRLNNLGTAAENVNALTNQ